MMIQHGANPEVKDNQGKTAFDLTCNEDMTKMLQLKPPANEEYSDELTSAFLSPLTEGSLSPISEKVSYTVTETEKIKNPEFSTFGKEEVQDVIKFRSTSQLTDRSSNLKPLYDWLESSNLGELYDVLLEAGYDDIQCMVEQMSSPMPISDSHLKSIGVTRPGHRKKLLLKLEEEAGITKRLNIMRSVAPGKAMNNSVFNCCVAPNNATVGLFSPPSLRDWLEDMKLGFLYQNFVESGYEDYEFLVCLSKAKKGINESVLEQEVLIKNYDYRTKILKKLKKDVEYYFPNKENSPHISFEEPKKVACELCNIM